MPPARPAPAPSISQTAAGIVRNSIGHALNGAIANAEKAPLRNAKTARFQPQARTISYVIARNDVIYCLCGRRRCPKKELVADFPYRPRPRDDGFRDDAD